MVGSKIDSGRMFTVVACKADQKARAGLALRRQRAKQASTMGVGERR